jgi:type IV secretory pathway component VirB8
MAEKANAPAEGALVKDSYYHDGARWERDIYRRLELSRNAWRLVAIGSLACLGIGLVGLALLIPLKSTEVVTLVVDKATGFTQVARPLEEGGPISQREAVTQANIVRYIRARETYDPPALRDNFELAALLSAGQASKDLQDEYSASDPQKRRRASITNTYSCPANSFASVALAASMNACLSAPGLAQKARKACASGSLSRNRRISDLRSEPAFSSAIPAAPPQRPVCVSKLPDAPLARAASALAKEFVPQIPYPANSK